MKRFASLAALGLWVGMYNVCAQQTEFPIGIFTFDGDSIDYNQMKDTLGLTWVQGWGGDDGHPSALEDSSGMNVMSMRWNPYIYSKAQRMIYEAEQDIWQTPEDQHMWNYFAVHPDSVSAQESDSRHSILGVHEPGYMARNPWPSNSSSDYRTYSYDRQYYYATFRMKITKANPPTDDSVAVLSILVYHNGSVISQIDSALFDFDFPNSNDFFNFKLQFTLELDPNAQNFAGQYLAGTPDRTTRLKCDSVDIRVYWNGYRTTWLDRVTVDDQESDALFAHAYDDLIRQQVDDFTSLPNVKRTYLFDEPQVPAFFPHEYVKRFIRDSVLIGNDRPGITASPWTDNWAKRFNQDAQPDELLFDSYVLTADVPSPSMTSNQATAAGVEPYTDNSQYNSAIQTRWDILEGYLAPVAILAHGLSPAKPIWFVPHLHGEYIVGTGKYKRANGNPTLRPPTGPEIHAQINMALAFGAKGVIPFPYGTIPDDSFDPSGSWMPGITSPTVVNGKYTDHSSNTASLPGNADIYTGYSEKWDSLTSINGRIKHLEQTLLSLTWQGAKSWKSNNTYATFDAVTGVSAKNTGGTADASPAALTGQFNNRGYLWVVNRRCDTRQNNMDTRDISLTLGTQQSSWLVTEILSDSTTGKAWVVKGGATFTDRFGPGEGKLYKLDSATVSGTKTFNNLKFIGGGVLTLASNANITVRGNMDTVNIILGSNAAFKADTGSTMVISRDSAFVFGSGSVLEIAGLLRTTYGNYTTVPYGSTLRLRPGAVLQWGSYGRLTIEGILSAIGTANSPITITRASGELAPSGIRLAYHSVDTLEHCLITQLYTGVAIDSCFAILRYNSFLNCTFALSSNGWKWSPVIEQNTVDSCFVGLDMYTTSYLGVPVMQGNDIQHCDYGVILNPSNSATLLNNAIHSNQTGILVDGSAPVLRGNVIENNSAGGVHATAYSNPRFGDYAFDDPGNNIVRYNGDFQLFSQESEPFLGEIFYEPSGDCESPDPSSTFAGFNSVYDPEGSSYLVLAEKSSTVTAVATWWGQCPPDESRIVTNSGTSYYVPALDYDPNEGMRPSMVNAGFRKEGQEPGRMDPQLRNTEFRQALLLRSRRDYTGALALYAGLIASNETEGVALAGLAELRHTYHDYIRWSNDTTLHASLETYLRTQSANHPRSAIRRLGKALRASELANMGNYADGIAEYQQLLQSSSSRNERITYLFNLFNLGASMLADRELAQQYLIQIQSEFPDDGRTRIAAVRFEAMAYRTPGGGLQRPSMTGTAEQTPELPRVFSVSQNYPNPFNPVTRVNYDLPEQAHVSLVVFDVLGRKVAELVERYEAAGHHDVSWDATDQASGVYFARFTATSAEGKPIYTKVNKLVLMK